MKIHVNRVPFEGLREEAAYDPKTLDLERFDVHLDEPIAVSSFITKDDEELVVQAEIRCVLGFSCARCIEVFRLPLQTAATLSYHVKPTDVIDITQDIRQEILLAFPMIPVCQETCRGLCRLCGQNLNVAPCQHAQHPE